MRDWLPHPLGELEPGVFFREFWKRRALVVRGAAPDAVSEPVEWASLVALAGCGDVESRLVFERGAAYPWQVVPGPLDREVLAGLPAEGWSLLVHAIEAHHEPAAHLLDRFDFLPAWSIDDVMLSQAPPGGSVGPHVDAYDAFLLQARGRRCWRLEAAPRREAADTLDDADLPVLREFRPSEEWILEPGDLLYVPPGLAHHGVALEAGQTWSVGLRAPGFAELLEGFVTELAGRSPGEDRLEDPDPGRDGNAGEILPASATELARRMHQAIDPSAILDWLGRHLTTASRGDPWSADPTDGPPRLLRDRVLVRAPHVRVAYAADGDSLRLFVAGETYHLPLEAQPLARALSGRRFVELASIDTQLALPGVQDTVTELVGNGLWSLRAPTGRRRWQR